MRLHQLKPSSSGRRLRRVGRGGKRGTFSGRGQKGQKARSAGLGPDFRGGNRPWWKVLPKRRGARKKTAIKHRFFQIVSQPQRVINLNELSLWFKEGEVVNQSNLKAKKIIRSRGEKIKILSSGILDKKLTVKGVKLSAAAQEKIVKAGGMVTS